MAAQFIHGLFQSTGGPVNTSIVDKWFPKKGRGLTFGLWTCHQYIGDIASGLTTAALINKASSEEGHFQKLLGKITAVLIGLAMVIVVILFVFIVVSKGEDEDVLQVILKAISICVVVMISSIPIAMQVSCCCPCDVSFLSFHQCVPVLYSSDHSRLITCPHRSCASRPSPSAPGSWRSTAPSSSGSGLSKSSLG